MAVSKEVHAEGAENIGKSADFKGLNFSELCASLKLRVNQYLFFNKTYFYPMRYKIPIEIIELESDNYHLIINSVFADGTKGNWVIDTGASKSVFDKSLAGLFLASEDETEELHSAGVSDEPMTTMIGYMKPFSIGRLQVENMKVALLDMSHINALYSKVTDLKICGLIGSDFLLKHKAVIDYKRKRMILSQSS